MTSFAAIYRDNLWGFGSGHGSLPAVTRRYRRLVERFVRQADVNRVLDLGCGDWQFSRLIDWQDTAYLGVDAVPDLIAENRRRFGSENIRFVQAPARFDDLPPADLLLIKDMLQHLPDSEVHAFLRILPRYRYALITNCVRPAAERNRDIERGGFRPLDLRFAPFYLNGEVVLTFHGPPAFTLRPLRLYPSWTKRTLLVHGKRG